MTVTFLDTGITESSTKARCEGNYAKKRAQLAQSVERRTLEVEVRRSKPALSTWW